jgi:arsenate reductase
VHPNEILVYYSPATTVGKKTIALAHSLSLHVKEVEYHKTPFTATMWAELLVMLKLRPKDVVNRSHPVYQEKLAGNNFEDEDWFQILIHNPDIISAPIVIRGNHAILCHSETDIFKLGFDVPVRVVV